MDTIDDIEKGAQYLAELYDQTRGDVAVQVSMYDIGEAVGLDREAAAKTAEELIGLGLVAVKTLSGGIGITDEGLTEANRTALTDGPGPDGQAALMGTDPLLGETSRHHVERIVAVLKTRAGEQSWEFRALTELMADLKTIDAQLISPAPKTAIIRACFDSICGTLEKAGGSGDMLQQIRRLLGG